MKDINSGKELVNKIKSFIKNYDFEIIASEGKSELTRFAESYIHQNVAENNINLIVKVINEDRISTVEMNSIDEMTILKDIENLFLLQYQLFLLFPLNLSCLSS